MAGFYPCTVCGLFRTCNYSQLGHNHSISTHLYRGLPSCVFCCWKY